MIPWPTANLLGIIFYPPPLEVLLARIDNLILIIRVIKLALGHQQAQQWP
jgi:hypothetical protein